MLLNRKKGLLTDCLQCPHPASWGVAALSLKVEADGRLVD